MLTSIDARRRWFGSLFLILAGGLLLWGLTLLNGFLVRNPVIFVLYWLTCFGLTGLSLGVAVYDVLVIRKRIRDEKLAALKKAFGKAEEDK